MSASDFYIIPHGLGQRLTLPRVTTILDILDKSRPLMGWAARIERESFKAALEDALTAPGELTAQAVWNKVLAALQGKRAYVKADRKSVV